MVDSAIEGRPRRGGRFIVGLIRVPGCIRKVAGVALPSGPPGYRMRADSLGVRRPRKPEQDITVHRTFRRWGGASAPPTAGYSLCLWRQYGWQIEGLFRTYKRTLQKLKLQHRTVALVFREAEGSLLALQLLLAWAVQAMEQEGTSSASPRRIVLRIRGAMTLGVAELGPRQLERYAAALEEIHGETPNRRSRKTRRVWPRRKPHKPPGAPKLRRLTEQQKIVLASTLHAA
jgi:hypothetical protein